MRMKPGLLPGRALSILIAGAYCLVLPVRPACSQDFGEHTYNVKPKFDEPRKIDEKAYKQALEKIPPPKEKYDPWSGARPSDQAKASKKPN